MNPFTITWADSMDWADIIINVFCFELVTENMEDHCATESVLMSLLTPLVLT